jgi:hypothetical protein
MPEQPQFRFEKLTVWQSSRRLAADIVRIDLNTRDTLLGLTSEITAQLTALNRSLTVSRSKTPFARKTTA